MLNVKMQRESNSTPWGFRMQGRIWNKKKRFKYHMFNIGGKDFGCPLQIQKVNPSSLAERCGMQANDYIVKIGQTSTEHLKHPDAQDLIKQQNNSLELTLQRYFKEIKINFRSFCH
jgi:C-terminal processing protease CtpA/Prc